MNGSLKGSFGGSLPIQASTVAESVDTLYIFLTVVSLFFFVVVVGCMIYFAIKYRQGVKAERKAIEGNVPLEIFWTIVPTIILLIMFAWGWVVYRDLYTIPPDAMEIKVVAKQWSWKFIYEDGRTTDGEMYVPVNKPVKVLMTSEDVLHDFFIPNFRVKQDVVPGMYTTIWFNATIPGEHQVFCAEYCGAGHSLMLAKVKVLTEEQWAQWQRGKTPGGDIPRIGIGMPLVTSQSAAQNIVAKAGEGTKLSGLAERGMKLSQMKGCTACHSTNGERMTGPTYKGLFGSEVQLADGTKVTADENYIKESIQNPQAKVVKGFAPQMPLFTKEQLNEEDIAALVSYIKTLK